MWKSAEERRFEKEITAILRYYGVGACESSCQSEEAVCLHVHQDIHVSKSSFIPTAQRDIERAFLAVQKKNLSRPLFFWGGGGWLLGTA